MYAHWYASLLCPSLQLWRFGLKRKDNKYLPLVTKEKREDVLQRYARSATASQRDQALKAEGPQPQQRKLLP